MRRQYHLRPNPDGTRDAWDVHRLLALAAALPVEKLAVADLTEVDSDWWDSAVSPMTPRELALHLRLTRETDVRYPVLVDPDGRLMDGMHRVVRALDEGRTYVLAVRLTELPPPDHAGVSAYDDLPMDELPLTAAPPPLGPHLQVSTVNLGTDDPVRLAGFYRDLLGGEILADEGDWVLLAPPTGVRLAFQLEFDHVPPVWPGGSGDQQMQVHLEVRVDDLHAGVDRALAAGARLADDQPQDDVRVCLDPAGHPFCLWTG